jgi:hypothetical protein
MAEPPNVPDVPLAVDSDAPATKPSRIPPTLRESDLLQRMLWSVPETAFMCRVGVRTVWRMTSDPKSGFPEPRRMRGRTLFARDEVLAFLAEGAAR